MKSKIILFVQWILKILAKRTISKYNPGIIGITGSVGKTSTKDAIYATLRNFKRTRATLGNFNAEIGMALTILGEWRASDQKLLSREFSPGQNKAGKTLFLLKVFLVSIIRLIFGKVSYYPEILILEYGADRPGDIKNLLEIVKPQISVITAIGDLPVHVGYYASPEAVAREKSRLIDNLQSNGFAILNADERLVFDMKEKTRAHVITFGFDKSAEVRITNFDNRVEKGKPIGVSFKLEYGGNFVPVRIDKCLGRQVAYTAAAAACTGIIFGMNLARVAESLIFYQPPKHRMRILKGIKSSTIIDDSYNASPLSMDSAIRTIKGIDAKRKVGVLGDMLELGHYSLGAHEELGALVSQVFDFLVTVGPHAKFIADSAIKSGFNRRNILSFDLAGEAVTKIENLIKEGDLILIKASRGIGLDRIADVIKKI